MSIKSELFNRLRYRLVHFLFPEGWDGASLSGARPGNHDMSDAESQAVVIDTVVPSMVSAPTQSICQPAVATPAHYTTTTVGVPLTPAPVSAPAPEAGPGAAALPAAVVPGGSVPGRPGPMMAQVAVKTSGAGPAAPEVKVKVKLKVNVNGNAWSPAAAGSTPISGTLGHEQSGTGGNSAESGQGAAGAASAPAAAPAASSSAARSAEAAAVPLREQDPKRLVTPYFKEIARVGQGGWSCYQVKPFAQMWVEQELQFKQLQLLFGALNDWQLKLVTELCQAMVRICSFVPASLGHHHYEYGGLMTHNFEVALLSLDFVSRAGLSRALCDHASPQLRRLRQENRLRSTDECVIEPLFTDKCTPLASFTGASAVGSATADTAAGTAGATVGAEAGMGATGVTTAGTATTSHFGSAFEQGARQQLLHQLMVQRRKDRAAAAAVPVATTPAAEDGAAGIAAADSGEVTCDDLRFYVLVDEEILGLLSGYGMTLPVYEAEGSLQGDPAFDSSVSLKLRQQLQDLTRELRSINMGRYRPEDLMFLVKLQLLFCAFAHDLGKLNTDLEIMSMTGERFNPMAGNLMDFCARARRQTTAAQQALNGILPTAAAASAAAVSGTGAAAATGGVAAETEGMVLLRYIPMRQGQHVGRGYLGGMNLLSRECPEIVALLSQIIDYDSMALNEGYARCYWNMVEYADRTSTARFAHMLQPYPPSFLEAVLLTFLYERKRMAPESINHLGSDVFLLEAQPLHPAPFMILEQNSRAEHTVCLALQRILRCPHGKLLGEIISSCHLSESYSRNNAWFYLRCGAHAVLLLGLDISLYGHNNDVAALTSNSDVTPDGTGTSATLATAGINGTSGAPGVSGIPGTPGVAISDSAEGEDTAAAGTEGKVSFCQRLSPRDPLLLQLKLALLQAIYYRCIRNDEQVTAPKAPAPVAAGAQTAVPAAVPAASAVAAGTGTGSKALISDTVEQQSRYQQNRSTVCGPCPETSPGPESGGAVSSLKQQQALLQDDDDLFAGVEELDFSEITKQIPDEVNGHKVVPMPENVFITDSSQIGTFSLAAARDLERQSTARSPAPDSAPSPAKARTRSRTTAHATVSAASADAAVTAPVAAPAAAQEAAARPIGSRVSAESVPAGQNTSASSSGPVLSGSNTVHMQEPGAVAASLMVGTEAAPEVEYGITWQKIRIFGLSNMGLKECVSSRANQENIRTQHRLLLNLPQRFVLYNAGSDPLAAERIECFYESADNGYREYLAKRQRVRYCTAVTTNRMSAREARNSVKETLAQDKESLRQSRAHAACRDSSAAAAAADLMYPDMVLADAIAATVPASSAQIYVGTRSGPARRPKAAKATAASATAAPVAAAATAVTPENSSVPVIPVSPVSAVVPAVPDASELETMAVTETALNTEVASAASSEVAPASDPAYAPEPEMAAASVKTAAPVLAPAAIAAAVGAAAAAPVMAGEKLKTAEVLAAENISPKSQVLIVETTESVSEQLTLSPATADPAVAADKRAGAGETKDITRNGQIKSKVKAKTKAGTKAGAKVPHTADSKDTAAPAVTVESAGQHSAETKECTHDNTRLQKGQSAVNSGTDIPEHTVSNQSKTPVESENLEEASDKNGAVPAAMEALVAASSSSSAAAPVSAYGAERAKSAEVLVKSAAGAEARAPVKLKAAADDNHDVGSRGNNKGKGNYIADDNAKAPAGQKLKTVPYLEQVDSAVTETDSKEQVGSTADDIPVGTGAEHALTHAAVKKEKSSTVCSAPVTSHQTEEAGKISPDLRPGKSAPDNNAVTTEAEAPAVEPVSGSEVTAESAASADTKAKTRVKGTSANKSVAAKNRTAARTGASRNKTKAQAGKKTTASASTIAPVPAPAADTVTDGAALKTAVSLANTAKTVTVPGQAQASDPASAPVSVAADVPAIPAETSDKKATAAKNGVTAAQAEGAEAGLSQSRLPQAQSRPEPETSVVRETANDTASVPVSGPVSVGAPDRGSVPNSAATAADTQVLAQATACKHIGRNQDEVKAVGSDADDASHQTVSNTAAQSLAGARARDKKS